MTSFRAMRRWMIAEVTRAATAVAPRLRPGSIDAIAGLVAGVGPLLPIVGRNVAGNMRALGVYTPRVRREYFAQLGMHFAGAVHMLRGAGRPGDARVADELNRVVDLRVGLDPSVSLLREAARDGRGAVIMGPHFASYLMGLARLSREVPLTIYFRFQKDARRQEAKERWCRAAGIGAIFEPETEDVPGTRTGRIADAVREGGLVFVPPDLPRTRDRGVAVRLFDRELYLPAGAAVLAMRTGAPLFTLLARCDGVRLRLVVHGPSAVVADGHGEAARRAAVQHQMQWFATWFETFLREQTALWYFWGDKRWTRALHGDAEYGRVLNAAERRDDPGTPRSKEAT